MTMTDFFEVDEKQKTDKILNLDDFSVEDLQNYISELQVHVNRKIQQFDRMSRRYFLLTILLLL